MTFDLALRLIEVAIGFAVLQRGSEHIRDDTWIFAPQMLLAACLMVGVLQPVAVFGLWLLGVAQLHRFGGPVNGGSDKMVMLILFCLAAAHLAPSRVWAELALSYLAIQLVLSYVVAGWVKLRNPAWRKGQALCDVFAFSAYPASDALRDMADRRHMLLVASWAVIGFEVLFPVSLLHPGLLCAGLVLAALFHFGNAICFGLNRFVWAWLSAFPALIWFQGRMLGGFG